MLFGLASGDYKHTYFNEAYDSENEAWNVVEKEHINRYLLTSQIKIKAENGEYIYFDKIANVAVRTLHL